MAVAKRNFSVSDSPWRSQKTTLAWPTMKIAQPFMAGLGVPKRQESRPGRQKTGGRAQAPFVSCGTGRIHRTRKPTAEAVGYFQKTGGRIYGDNFSRCGRGSRFQRTSAASLVSSKRNFSVGDSTWPTQKIALDIIDEFKERGNRHL